VNPPDESPEAGSPIGDCSSSHISIGGWRRSRFPTSRPGSSVRSRPPTTTPQADARMVELPEAGLAAEEVKIVEGG